VVGVKEAYGRVVVVGGNGVQSVKEGGELAREQAAGLLGNAQEQVGGQVEGVGRRIKGEK